MPELLAPAGGPAAAFAAFHFGADAVYLGLPQFSARAEAENFSWDSLGEIVAFAHAQPKPRKVYVAFNTLVLTREIPDAVRALERLAEIGTDGVIVQDLGVARLARKYFSNLILHASTQTTTHNIEGVRALAHLGFSRVVLARELTLGEVSEIARNSGIEAEVFIHGTLCYSYSGLCLFSSHATGRSGNRGRCAYCCRTTFGVGNDEVMPFSMKDLALGDRLGQLCDSGVASLKIEGRMKTALYVSAVTDYYRKLLDGKLRDDERGRLEEDLRTIFSRPWTRLYADGPAPAEPVIDSQTVGHRGALIGEVARVRKERDGDWLEFKSRRALEIHDGLQIDLPGEQRPFGFAVDDLRAAGRRETVIRLPAGGTMEVRLPEEHRFIPAGAPVYCSSSQEVKRRYPVERPRPGVYRCRHPLRVSIQLRADSLIVSGEAEIPSLGKIHAEEKIDGPFAAARQREGTLAAAQKAFERLGDTDWTAKAVELDDPLGLFVPASVWNETRRRLAVSLDAARDAARENRIGEILVATESTPPGAAQEEFWSLRLDAFPTVEFSGVSEIVVPLSVVADERPIAANMRAAIPLILRGEIAKTARQQIASLLRAGWRTWEAGNLAGLEMLRVEASTAGVDFRSLDVTSDWSVHTLNPQAALAGRELGIGRFITSPEDDGENLTGLLRAEGHRVMVLLLQFSPLFIAGNAPVIPAGQTQLRGRRGEGYVEVEQDGLHVLTSTAPFSLTQHLAELRAAGARNFRVDLSRAAAAEADVRALWSAARAGDPIPNSHDGNYRRGLQ